MRILPKASRPSEHVAFFVLEIPTQEGMGYVFLGCDSYSQFAFLLGTEMRKDAQTILKNVQLLMEDENFMIHENRGFILVIGEYEELLEHIDKIVLPHNGKVVYDPVWCKQISKPLIEGMREFGM